MNAWSDVEVAVHLASAAGQILRQVRFSGAFSQKSLGKAGDKIANQFLVSALSELRPQDGLLSEEQKDSPERLQKHRVWIIDPVDGTREFGEDRPDWAVHVGLAVDGKPVVGAVALPGRHDSIVLSTEKQALPRSMPDIPRVLVSRTRPANEAVSLAESIGGQLVPMGSAGAKAMAVVLGDAEIYLHSGGQYEWDSCAPVAVAMAHGLHCSRIDGSPLIYNQPDPWMPDLLICRPEWSDRVLSVIQLMTNTSPARD